MIIHKDQAWAIARTFAEDAANLLRQGLLAVYVIGSLAGGNYRPGRSDIDTLLIVSSGSTTSDQNAVEDLRRRVRAAHGGLKDFGAVVITEGKLQPPYDPVEELVPEILRLKHQGALIWGAFDLASVPDPTRDDFVAYVRVFYPWLRELIDRRPQEYRSVDAAVNTILYELRLLIWNRTGDYVLDKHRVIPAAVELDSGATLASETLEAIQCYLVGDEPLSREQVERELQVVSEYVRNQVQWSVPPFAPALIRPLTEHDIEQFLAWRAGDDYVCDIAGKEIQEHLEGKRVLLVAEAGGQLVGTVQFVPAHVDSDLADGKTTAYLQALEVREDFRRRGLGTHLVRAVERIGTDRGFTRLTLMVEPDNGPALSLHRKLGFEVFKNSSELWRGKPLALLCMRRALASPSRSQSALT